MSLEIHRVPSRKTGVTPPSNNAQCVLMGVSILLLIPSSPLSKSFFHQHHHNIHDYYRLHDHHHQVGNRAAANGLWTATTCSAGTMLGICEYEWGCIKWLVLIWLLLMRNIQICIRHQLNSTVGLQSQSSHPLNVQDVQNHEKKQVCLLVITEVNHQQV